MGILSGFVAKWQVRGLTFHRNTFKGGWRVLGTMLGKIPILGCLFISLNEYNQFVFVLFLFFSQYYSVLTGLNVSRSILLMSRHLYQKNGKKKKKSCFFNVCNYYFSNFILHILHYFWLPKEKKKTPTINFLLILGDKVVWFAICFLASCKGFIQYIFFYSHNRRECVCVCV